MKQKSRIPLFLLLGLVYLTLNFIPDLVSDELKLWCAEHFGPKYPWYFIGFSVIATFVLLWFGDLKELLGSQSPAADPALLNIRWSLEAKKRLQEAKEVLANADPRTALTLLYTFDTPYLNERLTMLSSRLAKHHQDNIAGIQATEEKNIAFNRLTKDILALINALEAGFLEKETQNRKIRESLQQRYQERLKQKLAFRQAVKLRKWMSSEGTSALLASTFKTYPDTEIPEEIGRCFQDAHGRLLVVGQAGMGKTTLLLQLADRLFALEADALPILLNLASWQSDFIKLETWLEEVLASELSTNKSGAKAVLQQSNLILLLDGLDELKEESAMTSCLAAIAEYGATAGRRFVISCRIEEYKAVQEDARVNMQLEVGPLDADELIVELEKMAYHEPEAKLLAQAIRSDELLREAVKTPFYFNTLQLLYAGRTPKFTSRDLEGLKSEIEKQFIEYALSNTKGIAYPAESSGHWLSFLAKKMTDKSKVVFELLDLQYDWFVSWNKHEKFTARFIEGVVGGLVGGLVFIFPTIGLGLVFSASTIWGIILGLMTGLGVGISISIPIGLIGLLVPTTEKSLPVIKTVDFLTWDRTSRQISAKILIASWFILSPLFLLINSKMLVFVIILATLLPILILIFESINGSGANKFVLISHPLQRFYGSFQSLYFSIIQHLHLRYLLYKKNLLPWHLVLFLNEMVARNILETDGATWRFRHRIIQEYFAERWVEDEEVNP